MNLDDRSVVEIKRGGGGNWLPRARALYRARLLAFDEYDTDDEDGFEIKIEIMKAQLRGKQHRDMHPVANVCDVLTYRFKLKPHEYPNNKLAVEQDLRQFLAAVSGEEVSPTFKANAALEALSRLSADDALGDLDMFWIECDAYPGKNARDGRYFINMRLACHPSDWDPATCTLGDVVKARAPDADDDDEPAPVKRAAKRAAPEPDDEDDEPAPVKRAAKRAPEPAPVKRAAKRAPRDDEDDEDARDALLPRR